MVQAEINFDRAIRKWGKEGQHLIENSSLVVVGLDKIGCEIAKSAAILGVQNLHLIDGYDKMYDKFLDIKPGNKPRAHEISGMMQKHLNSNCQTTGYQGKLSMTILDDINYRKGIDGIIDVSNDPYSQYKCAKFSKENQIPLFVGAADKVQGQISFYSPLKDYDMSQFKLCLPGFEASTQGTIISNILAPVIMEEYRKNLFINNKSIFKNVKYCDRAGNEKSFYQEIIKYIPLLSDFEYSINDSRRTNQDSNSIINIVRNSKEDGLKEKKILMLGCGAIGNYAADILARLDTKNVDVADFDRFESTNLNRQPLAYSSVGKLKSQIVSKRMNNIAGRKISKPIIGFIGDNYDIKKIKEARTNPKDVILMNKEWFKQNNYDAIIGCFDNREARLQVSEYAVELGLNYFDGGTSPESGNVYAYSPGLTNRMFNNPKFSTIKNIADFVRKNNEALDKKRKENQKKNPNIFQNYINIESNSCHQDWIEPSINMPNQIIGAIMVSEVRRLFNPKYGNINGKISYKSNSIRKITIEHNELRCNCSK